MLPPAHPSQVHGPSAATPTRPEPNLDPLLAPRRDPQRPGRATGPRTAEGKARSSRNALKHGLTSEQAVLPEESAEDFEALRQDFMDDLQPVGTTELDLVETMAMASWKLRRVWRMEPGVFANWRAKAGPRTSAGAVWALDCMADGSLEKLGRQEARLSRMFHQCERALQLRQKLRAAGLERPYRASDRQAGRWQKTPAAGASPSTDSDNGENAKRTPAPDPGAQGVVKQAMKDQPQPLEYSPDDWQGAGGATATTEINCGREGGIGETAKRTPAPIQAAKEKC